MFLCLNADRDSIPDLEVLACGISAFLEQLHDLATGSASVVTTD